MLSRLSPRLTAFAGACLFSAMLAPAIFAQAPAANAVPANTLLRTESPWRAFVVLKSEEVRLADGTVKCGKVAVKGDKIEVTALADETLVPPPADWFSPTFDDSSWGMMSGAIDPTKLTGRILENTWPRNMAAICLRSQFEVGTPSDMVLNLGIRGGAIVYLNGKEIARLSMLSDKVAIDTLAEDYPPEAYFGKDGKLIMRNFIEPTRCGPLMQARIRKLTDVKIPATALQKGVNVLALELHRAPSSEVMYTGKREHDKFARWTMLSLENISLVASNAATLISPCKGSELTVWNCPTLKKVINTDGGFYHGALTPVTLFGAKNGSFSGQVVVEAAAAIKGLKGVATDLKGDKGGTIPAASVVVRYGLYDDYVGSFDPLEDQMPADIAVVGGKTAMCPVWFTVRVPKDAKPESYEGKVTLQAEGAKPVDVTIKIKVSNFTLPDPTEYVSFLDMAQSPETLADAYKVPLWSDAHWALIDKSFEQMA